MTILRFPCPQEWGIEPPLPSRRGRKVPRFLSKEQADRLLKWCADEAARDQCPSRRHMANVDYLAIQFGLHCGLRVAEICGVTVDRIDLATAQMLVLGKGRKERYLPLKASLVEHLVRWLGKRTCGPVLYSCRGMPLKSHTIHWRVKRCGRLSGVCPGLHPHMLRHSYATLLLQSGADLREVQELMRHENLATTSVYCHCCPQRTRAAVERL